MKNKTPTAKQLVKQALAYKQSETVPYYMKFLPTVLSRLQHHFNTENVDEVIGNCIASFHIKEGRGFVLREMPDGTYYDEFNCLEQHPPFKRISSRAMY